MIQRTQINLEQIHGQLNAERDQGQNPDLRTHFAQNYSELYPENPVEALDKFLYERGIDLNSTTVSNMLDFDGDRSRRWLFAELYLAAVQKGITEFAWVDDLLAVKANPQAPTVVLPFINTEGMRSVVKEGKEVAPGAEFEKNTVSVGDKRQGFKKFGSQLDMPYETIQDCTLNSLFVFLRGQATVIMYDRLVYITDVIVNGDGAVDKDNNVITDSAAVIGVANTTNGVQYIDILRSAIQMSMLGRPPQNMIGDPDQMLSVLLLDEYKQRYAGTVDTKLTIKGNIVTPDSGFIVPSIPGSYTGTPLILMSKNFTIGQFTRQGLKVETDKLITRQIEKAVVSLRIAYLTFFRDARLIIDSGLEYASNGFPAHMQLKAPAA